MHEIRTLGSWLERFFLEHIVTERNLALNTRDSYLDSFKLLVPFLSIRLRKPDHRLAVRDLTSKLVLQFLAHRGRPRLLHTDPKPAPVGSARLPALWPAATRPYRMVRPDPGHSVEEGEAAANWMAD